MAKDAHLLVPVDGKVHLDKIDPKETHGLSEARAKTALIRDVQALSELHDLLYANGKRALLIVLQGMDSAGKDGTIRHVMQGLSPQGTVVSPFKQPTEQELAHDFLWRVHQRVPAKGAIGIFNRSHYEDVLVVRVHHLISDQVAKERLRAIRHFERELDEAGVIVRKFFLHLSREEQAKRFEERRQDRRKNWKMSAADFQETKLWDHYQRAYEEAIEATSTKDCPWYVVPSDHRWYRNLLVAKVLVHTLKELKMDWPLPAEDAVLAAKASPGAGQGG